MERRHADSLHRPAFTSYVVSHRAAVRAGKGRDELQTRAETARFGWTRWNWDKTFRGVRSRSDARGACLCALVGTAFALRLVDLSSRAFDHDESQHGYFSWLFSTGDGYDFDPILHRPLRDLITGSLFFLFGDGDFSARLGSALFGSLLVGLPFLLRRQLGRTAAFTAAVIFCVSPAYLYYSRFEREDIYVAALTLALTVTVFRFLDWPRPWHPSSSSACSPRASPPRRRPTSPFSSPASSSSAWPLSSGGTSGPVAFP